MNPKSKYYQVFGLKETASKHEIRSSYRKLAMQYHPDKNPDPKAHKLFVDLTEAYKILLNDDYKAPQIAAVPRKEKTEAQRIKEAQIRLKYQKYREYNEQERYFKKLTSGKSWRLFKWFSYLSAGLALLLLVDRFLPTHFETHSVAAYSNLYNGVEYSNVRYVRTQDGLNLFIDNLDIGLLNTDPQLTIERSWIFRNPVRVLYRNFFTTQQYAVDFSVINLYPAVSILFLVPLITVWYRRRSYIFSIAYFFSRYLVLICVLYFLFTQDRWAHLLLLGYF